MALVLNFEDVLSCKRVEVVESIDVGQLQLALQAIVAEVKRLSDSSQAAGAQLQAEASRAKAAQEAQQQAAQAAQDGRLARVEEELQAARAATEEAQAAAKGLHARVEELTARLPAAPAPSAPEPEQLGRELASLKAEVESLREAQASLKASIGEAPASLPTEGEPPQAPQPSSEARPFTPPSIGPLEPTLSRKSSSVAPQQQQQPLRQAVEQLREAVQGLQQGAEDKASAPDADVAIVERRLAAAEEALHLLTHADPGGVAEEVDALAHSVAEVAARQLAQEAALEGLREASDQLRKEVGGKASTEELDALTTAQQPGPAHLAHTDLIATLTQGHLVSESPPAASLQSASPASPLAPQGSVGGVATQTSLSSSPLQGTLPRPVTPSSAASAPGGTLMQQVAVLRERLASRASEADLDALAQQLAALQASVGAFRPQEGVEPLAPRVARLEASAQQEQPSTRILMRRSASMVADRASADAALQQRVAELGLAVEALHSGQALPASSSDKEGLPAIAEGQQAGGRPASPPRPPWSAGSKESGGSRGERPASALSGEIEELRSALSVITNVSKLMALGPQPEASVVPQKVRLSRQERELLGEPLLAAAAPTGPAPSGGQVTPQGLAGSVEELSDALQRGAVRHKADSGSSGPRGAADASLPFATKADFERRLKRLGGELAAVKRRLEAGSFLQPRNPDHPPDGDYTMLARKPILGYRNLAALDGEPGPKLPGGSLPVTVPFEYMRSHGVDTDQYSQPPRPATAAPGSMRSTSAEGPYERGPQNWYEESHGSPAEQLPSREVGPRLPGGGWRGAVSSSEGSLLLPSSPAGRPALQTRPMTAASGLRQR